MKTTFYKLTLILLATGSLLFGCKKEDTAHVSKEVAVSFPEITLKGDEVVVLPVGGTYTDAGATLKDDVTGATSDIGPTTSDVNTAEAGLYLVTYAASNANGFETSVTRYVAVTSVVSPVNRAGTYLRELTGINCYIDKIADGVYKVTNPGGAGAGVNTVVYFVETEPNVYVCPEQPTDAGTMSVENINFTATGSTWNVNNAGYGSQQRIFTKQ
jgi:hypothetical protein